MGSVAFPRAASSCDVSSFFLFLFCSGVTEEAVAEHKDELENMQRAMEEVKLLVAGKPELIDAVSLSHHVLHVTVEVIPNGLFFRWHYALWSCLGRALVKCHRFMTLCCTYVHLLVGLRGVRWTRRC